METTVKLYSLNFRQAKTYWFTLLFVAGNLILPQLCHLIPQGGLILLPIYFFTLIAIAAATASVTDLIRISGSTAAAGIPNSALFASGESTAVSRPTRMPNL